MCSPRRRRILHAGPPRPGRDPERIRLEIHRCTRLLRTARRQHLFERLLPRRSRPHGEVRAGTRQDYVRRSFRRNPRRIYSASSKAISISITKTSTRSPAPIASTTPAAPKKPRSISIRASRTPKADPSTPPPDTKSWPTRTDSSANIRDLTARWLQSPSRRRKKVRCSATTGTRSRAR